jgi:hypothetical protein
VSVAVVGLTAAARVAAARIVRIGSQRECSRGLRRERRG